MKKIIVLSLAALISGCSMFRKVEKEKIRIESSIQQGSHSQVIEKDTGSTTTSEHWKFRIPLFSGSEVSPKDYVAPLVIGSGNSELKNSLNNLNSKNLELSGTIGYLEAELTRFINDKRGTDKSTIASDTTSNTIKSETDNVKKDPVMPWYFILLIGAAGAMIIKLFGFLINKLVLKK